MKTIINTKFVKKLAFAALALTSLGVFAQEEEEKSLACGHGVYDRKVDDDPGKELVPIL